MIQQGDALEVLRTMPAESVQCCVTSPPYWGLRDYGHAGQMGLERTPAEYVAGMVAVFEEVRRVLKPDGVLWLNLGDSYATGGGAVGRAPGGGDQGERFIRAGMINTQSNRMPLPGLKPKDLIGIPWRVAFALQEAGWYLRCDVIWSKPNPMPESVTDRPTKAHEYIFLLTKSERYYYNAGAIKERATGKPPGNKTHRLEMPGVYPGGAAQVNLSKIGAVENRNRRSVWTITTRPFSEAHFATFPEEIPTLCILAGSRHGDVVLDPFNGAGTVGVVCAKTGREYVGIELNPAYVAMSERRIGDVAPLFNQGAA